MVDINVYNGIVARTIKNGDQIKTEYIIYDKTIPEQCAVLNMLAYTISTTNEQIFYVPDSTYSCLDSLTFEEWMDNETYERECERGTYNVWESAIEGVKNLITNKEIRNSRDLYYQIADQQTLDLCNPDNVVWMERLTPKGDHVKQAYVRKKDLDQEVVLMREQTIKKIQEVLKK